MRWVNPLYSPLSVLLGCVVLGLGVRVLRAPSLIVIPLSVATATLSAGVLASKSSSALGSPILDNPILAQELVDIQQQGANLGAKSSGSGSRSSAAAQGL